jgi:hypothetical protein
MSDLTTDGILENTFSVLANRQTGIGTGRDKSALTEINLGTPLFTDTEVNALYRQSNLLRKIVNQYPLDASRNWLEWTANDSSFDPAL